MLGAGAALTVSRRDGEVVVAVAGELDAYNANAFAQNVLAHCTDAPCRVVINATLLDFLDSGGIQGLVRILREVRGEGGEVTLTGASANVQRILDITGFAALPAVHVVGSAA